jgi:hypothetical protein
MEYRKLEGPKSRARHRRVERIETNNLFAKAWGADKTTKEILGNLNRDNTPRNIIWVTAKACSLRKQGYNLPRRDYDGQTPTARKLMGYRLFSKFWNLIEEAGSVSPETGCVIRRAKRFSALVDTNLMQLFEGSNMTTDKLIELVPYSRVTLLRRLRALEDAGFVTCTLANYGGRGRGYNWNIN